MEQTPHVLVDELLPELPRDVLRIIWQTVWRAQAASQLQRACRAHRLRRMLGQGWWKYVLKYVSKDVNYWYNVEHQSRGAVHMHALMWPAHIIVGEPQSRDYVHVHAAWPVPVPEDVD